jgi:flagellin
MRELAIQAANGTLGTSERASLNLEFQDLLDEIDRIASVTQFNGITILADGTASVTFQVGVNGTSADTITVSGVAATASAIGIAGLTVSTQALAQATLSALDNAIGAVASLRATFGTTQNRLESTIRSIATAVENISAAESRIRDVDVAEETATLTRNQVLQQAGVSILAQANISTSIALSLLG